MVQMCVVQLYSAWIINVIITGCSLFKMHDKKHVLHAPKLLLGFPVDPDED